VKVALVGFDLPEKKVKYEDDRLKELEKKVSPKKSHPFFVEFTGDKPELADIIICLREKILDILIPDLEKLERQLQLAQDEQQKELLTKCVDSLEKEVPLYDLDVSKEEQDFLRQLQFLTIRPTLVEDKSPDDLGQLLKVSFDKAKIIFFYTTAKGELKSWPIKKGTTVVEAASKIHTDLARGFIKAEVINFSDFANVHNIQEAKTRGLVKVVNKDYIVEDGDIIEIRFNV